MEATEGLRKQVEEQGNVVRELKTNKAPKEEISAALNKLFSLKTELKEAQQLEMGNLLEEISKLKNENGDENVIKEKEARVEQLQKFLEPLHERRAAILARPGIVEEILAEGRRRAQISVNATMELVREAMHMN